MAVLDKVRIDKWLWSVRIFKTRTQATDAVKGGRVRINGSSVKASSPVQRGDKVDVRKEGFNFEFVVKDLIQKRVGAPIAQTCYDNVTPEEELNKFKDWFVGKGAAERREKGAGRPTKRDRRTLEDFKDGYFFDFEDE